MDCDGKVMIGSTSNPTKDLDVRGEVSFKPSSSSSWKYIIDNTGGPYSNNPVFYPSHNGTINLGKSDKRFYQVYAYQFLDPSDKELKENIREIENSLQLVLNLKGVKYDYKAQINTSNDMIINEKFEEQRKNKIGFIAQDMNEVLPEAIIYDKQAGIYNINYSSVIPVLVEAIKEQQSQIKILQDEIDKLNGGNS